MYSQTDQMLNQASAGGYAEQKAQREPMAVSVIARVEKEAERLKMAVSALEARLGTVCRSDPPQPEPAGIEKATELLPPLLDNIATIGRRISGASNALESLLRRLEV